MRRRAVLASLLATAAAPLPAVVDRPAPLADRPERAMLLAVTRAGGRLVAAGARGRVVLSDDGGASWRQAAVPTSVTLTAVAFATPLTGWAVGHMGVILRTSDGGESWRRVTDGLELAEAELAAAERQDRAAFAGSAEAAARLVADGPDKPFLAVTALPDGSGFVAGGFGIAAQLAPDGGAWRPAMGRLGDEKQSHVYGLAANGDRAYAAGEQGLFLRWEDGRFSAVPTPWPGTFFGVLAGADGQVSAFGLRGTLLHSTTSGAAWRQADLPTNAAITCGAMVEAAAVFGTATGHLALLRPDGQAQLVSGIAQPVTGIADPGGTDIVLVGPRGTELLPKARLAGGA